MIKNFNSFVEFELLIESLILESKLEFSTNFLDILKEIKRNRIAKEILNLKKGQVDADFIQNFIDISSLKDEVTFTPDRKAKEFFDGENIIKYKVTHREKHLTHSPRNDDIFNKLGYIKPSTEPWDPIGSIGIIKAEATSARGVDYVWFVSGDKETVVNKSAIVPFDEKRVKIWNSFRNNIKIGRFVRSILTIAEIQFTDKEIEDFVNAYKSIYDITQNAFSKLELVTGEKIAIWYDGEKYESDRSVLGGSCMAGVDSDYFDIYCKNPNCSLLILYSDNNGKISDGRFRSNKIKGRALIWTTTTDIFMDRIYTNDDSDVELFRKYAAEKGWWYKVQNISAISFNVSNGTTSKEAQYIVRLENSDFNRYPYFDSLIYLNTADKKISNMASAIEPNRAMTSTSGGYSVMR